jgi:hypothetical protein
VATRDRKHRIVERRNRDRPGVERRPPGESALTCAEGLPAETPGKGGQLA